MLGGWLQPIADWAGIPVLALIALAILLVLVLKK